MQTKVQKRGRPENEANYACTCTLKHTHSLNIIVHYVIYWRVYWLSGVILGVCLVWLLLTVKYTFIHIIVVLLLLSLVFSFICIIVKIAIDFFYNREIKPLFRYLPVFLLYGVQSLSFVLCLFLCC